MATSQDCLEHESSPKRPRLDPEATRAPARCSMGAPAPAADRTQPPRRPQDVPDYDSGYEATTMGSMPTPPYDDLSGGFPGKEKTNESTESSDFKLLQGMVDPDDGEDDDDDNASTVSELSGLSDLSGQDWKPMAGSMTWIQKQMQNGMDPRAVLIDLGVDAEQIPQFVDNLTLWKLIVNMLAEPPRRHKLRHVNTLDDIVRLLKGAQKIIVLTGAGVSVSCGIPDFRSRDGIYSRLAVDFPDLPDPQAMFDITYFSQDPRPFFRFAKDIYPGKFRPSPCHRFIKLLEKHTKLLRNYTQNIDTLEKVADIERVIECHGSFATATCTKCLRRVTADEIRETVLAQNIPVCEVCRPDVGAAISLEALQSKDSEELKELVSSGIMKPDIVFFGEGLPDSFHEAMSADKNECDLLVVIGSSLKVRPVALIPSSLPAHVPQILINREPLPHCHFDIELLGDCDVIINHLCHMLGANWESSIHKPEMLKEALHLLPWATSDKSTPTPPTTLCNVDDMPCECTKQEEWSKPLNDRNRPSIDDEAGLIKSRHMSIDSARDSGIGENSNFADLEDSASTQPSFSELTDGNTFSGVLEETKPKSVPQKDMQGYWQPKQKRSITERLPDNTYYLIQPSRYVFPGAELFYDPDEKCSYLDTTSSDSSDSGESENENENENEAT